MMSVTLTVLWVLILAGLIITLISGSTGKPPLWVPLLIAFLVLALMAVPK